MSLDHITISWSANGQHFSLGLTGDGKVVPTEPPTPLAEASPAPRGPARRGKPWSAPEDGDLRLAFTSGEDPEAIAEELGRSVGAVRARLVGLGLMEAEHAGLRYPVAPVVREAEAPTAPNRVRGSRSRSPS